MEFGSAGRIRDLPCKSREERTRYRYHTGYHDLKGTFYILHGAHGTNQLKDPPASLIQKETFDIFCHLSRCTVFTAIHPA